jgi:hypothetical protein
LCLWLAFAAIQLPACAPQNLGNSTLVASGPIIPASNHAALLPIHGHQFYNSLDAKFLGADHSTEVAYFLIDSPVFEAIRADYRDSLDDIDAVRRLDMTGRPITVDSAHIQADLQWIKDSTAITGKEYQVYLYLDRSTGLLSSLHGEPGTDHDSHPYIATDRNHGTVSPIPVDGPIDKNRILIGQVHGHPAKAGLITLHRMSPEDSLTAACLQTPIYAIDAMDGRKGTAGSIHRANPNAGGAVNSQDLFIGKTCGAPGILSNSIFDIGLNALQIWGRSGQPDFATLLSATTALTLGTPNGSPAKPSSPHRPRSPIHQY